VLPKNKAKLGKNFNEEREFMSKEGISVAFSQYPPPPPQTWFWKKKNP
jgi:hypothetical protein